MVVVQAPPGATDPPSEDGTLESLDKVQMILGETSFDSLGLDDDVGGEKGKKLEKGMPEFHPKAK